MANVQMNAFSKRNLDHYFRFEFDRNGFYAHPKAMTKWVFPLSHIHHRTHSKERSKKVQHKSSGTKEHIGYDSATSKILSPFILFTAKQSDP